GSNWGEAIIRGIESCRVLLLVLSHHSNLSQQILQEVERAVAKNLIVVPFRIDDVTVSSQLELYVGARHWRDAFDGSLEGHARDLAEVLRSIVSSRAPAPSQQKPVPQAKPKPKATPPRAPRARTAGAAAPKRRAAPWVAAGSAVVLGAAFLGWRFL